MAVKTQLSDVRWQVDVYPYKTFYPQPRESEDSDVFDTAVTVSEGIQGISLSRSKTSVNDTCTIDLYGPINKAFFKGNWVIIRSKYGKNADKEKNGFPQFFGQIEHLVSGYFVNSNGKISQSSTITIRSWAFVLRSPVKFDQFAMSQLDRKDAVGLAKIAASVNKNISPEKLADLITKAANPFEFGAIILSLIGGIDKLGQESTGKYINFISGELPTVSLTTPRVHSGLFKVLIPNVPERQESNVSSFLSYISGISTAASSSFLTNGYFQSLDEFDSFTKTYINPEDRPINTGFAPILLNGDSAWDLLEQMTDVVCNELLADFYCVKRTDGLIWIKPFVTVRDKPYAMKRQIDALEGELNSKWSSYDNVPRITIDASQILSLQLSDSFIDSPNFIRVQYNNSELANEYIKATAALSSTIRKKDAMARYGGQAIYPFTSFVDLQGSFMDYWYSDLAAMIHIWQGLKYKMPDMRLSIKDLAVCFTVGTNLQFEIAGVTYVGHIESFAKSYRVGENGSHTSSTSLSLSRVVIVNKQDGLLDFMPPEYILDLFNRKPVVDQNREVKKGEISDRFRKLL